MLNQLADWPTLYVSDTCIRVCLGLYSSIYNSRVDFGSIFKIYVTKIKMYDAQDSFCSWVAHDLIYEITVT